MLSQKGDESFLLGNGADGSLFDFSQEKNSAPDGALEKQEIAEFVFDGDQIIDVDALEQYVMERRDVLVQAEEPLHIDISQMMVSRKTIEAAKRGPNAVKQHMEVEEQEMK
jgi:hypothetical protein